MLNRPSFRACFGVGIAEPEAVFLTSERIDFLLEGRLYQLLAPLIDGQHTVDEIIELMQGKASASEVYYALMHMAQQGYIAETQNNSLPASAVFCDTFNVYSREVECRLQSTKVAVKSIGFIPASELISSLESLQVQVSKDADIEIVLTDDYLGSDLDAINQQALSRSHPWMLVKPVGTIVWIGPIFHPGKTGCWECLAQRIRGNKPIEEFFLRHQKVSIAPPLACLPSTQQTALSIAATEIFKWIVRGRNEWLEGRLLSYDTFSLTTESHTLIKRPQCPRCGDPSLMQKPLPIILGSRKKNFTADGGHRYCSPEETLRKYQHHISPIAGVIRQQKKVSPVSNGLIHTYVVSHHFATMFDDIDALRVNLGGGRSSGKGKTDSQARASGLCEAIERYSRVFQGDEPRQQGSYRQLEDKAIHPNACMNFSQEQYRNREEWNGSHPSNLHNQKVPEPFDESRKIEWTPVWSLNHQEFKYLPTAYCYEGYPKPLKPDCWSDSNGCAAGNTIEEAILQGFMELVERDCVALWWYNRVKRPKVDVDSFDDPYFQDLKDYYQTLNRELWVLDITSDFNIPTFAAISRRIDREVEDIIYGFGAHFDPRIAIERSLTEVNQNLANVGTANADGSTRYPRYSDLFALEWWKTATIENQPYLTPDQSVTPKVRSDYSQIWSNDLRDDVRTCQQLVEVKGMEILILDQTRPDIGLKVVKVIVPGMRHFWRRFGSGRLYEVPVQLGWLKESLSEHQLNSFPIWW